LEPARLRPAHRQVRPGQGGGIAVSRGGLPNEAATDGAKADGGARLDGANPFGDTLFTDRNWKIVDTLKAVASEVGEPPAKVALAWALSRPAVDTVLIGVSRVAQLRDNMGAVSLRLSAEHLAALDAASQPELPMLYGLFSDEMRRQVVYGGAPVAAR
jgi:aryl-alcohol dehydrogenase-like predicted oxidoreductase